MKIDMHCHVKEGSIDSKVGLDEYITKLKQHGFQGMVITDHDTYNGYRYWKQHIKGKKHTDFVVLKGIEYDTRDAGHIIVIMPEGVKMRVLEMRGMQSVRDQFAGALPLGWKQKLAFSIAMVHDPGIIFLDEPTGGVDPETRRRFLEMIYEAAGRGVTIFVTTHYMDEAEYCDRVSVMVDGRIAALDSPDILKTEYHARNMDEVFRIIAGREE